MSKRCLLAVYDNFDDAEAAIGELRTGLKGFNASEDLVIQSPIDLPEVDPLLERKPAYVQWFTLVGAILGGFLAFWLVAGAEADFYAQLKGGKPIVPIPPNLVVTYEMFILGGVLFTVIGFLLGAGLPARRSALYSPHVSEAQVGVLVKCEDGDMETCKAICARHRALEIQAEAGQ